MANEFYALMGRMRYITRWGLMRNTFSENIQEHSHQVAVLAHALALIRRDILHLPVTENGSHKKESKQRQDNTDTEIKAS